MSNKKLVKTLGIYVNDVLLHTFKNEGKEALQAEKVLEELAKKQLANFINGERWVKDLELMHKWGREDCHSDNFVKYRRKVWKHESNNILVTVTPLVVLIKEIL